MTPSAHPVCLRPLPYVCPPVCLLLACAFAILSPHLAAQEPSTPPPISVKSLAVTPSRRHQLQAANAFLAGSRQMGNSNPAKALPLFQKAATLDPSDPRYSTAAEIARQNIITAMVHHAMLLQSVGSNAQADAILHDASRLDPANPLVLEHLQPSPSPTILIDARPSYAGHAANIPGPVLFQPNNTTHSYHLHIDSHQMLTNLLKDYGLSANLNADVPTSSIRLDIDDVDFPHLLPILEQLTNTLIVPLQPKEALVVKNTRDNRDAYTHLSEETINLSGFSSDQMTEAASMLRDVLEIQHITTNSTSGTITIRAPDDTLRAANLLLGDLLQGSNELLLEMKVYSLDRTRNTNTGLNLSNTITAFSLYTQAQQILNQYQTQIQSLIANGTIPSTATPLQILGGLIASGLLSGSSLLPSNILGTFSNGITWSALSSSSLPSFNLGLNSSSAQALDQIQLRASDHKATTFRSGSKYPIVTSSYTSGGVSSSLISQLSSSQLAALGYSSASSAAAAAQSVTIPQITYEDLGLTLKATPTVLRSGQVQLLLDLKTESLGGSTLNGNPILNSRALTSTITLEEGQSAVLVSDLSRQESRAISGAPGLSEIPGFQDISDIDSNRDNGELIILLTPRIIRRAHGSSASHAVDVSRDADK